MTLYMYQASYTAKSMAAQLTEPHDPMEAIGPTLEDLEPRSSSPAFRSASMTCSSCMRQPMM